MRPVDALSRHASSWGWLVTVSAFALLTAGLAMAVWWAATDEERTATYQVRGSVTACWAVVLAGSVLKAL